MNAVPINNLLADRVRAHRALNMLPTDYLQHRPITLNNLVRACGQLQSLAAIGAIAERDVLLALDTLAHHSTMAQQPIITPGGSMTTSSTSNIVQQHTVTPGTHMTTGFASNIAFSPSNNIIQQHTATPGAHMTTGFVVSSSSDNIIMEEYN